MNIDGSYLEGGGQIVRTALALSTLTGKPFKITDIRKGRKQPGLKHQHLTAVKALKLLCNAKVKGDELGSQNLEYSPGKLKYHNLNIDIGTAGSITLLLQALLPVLLASDKKIIIKLRGGTDTKYSQPIDYFINVFLPHLKKYADFQPILEKRGYYPKGGGKFILKINPKTEKQEINVTEQNNLLIVRGVSHASKDLMRANVAERQAKAAKYLLKSVINIEYVDTLSTGSGITLWALFGDDEVNLNNPVILGADSLGERGKKAEKVGEEAGQKLKQQIDSKAAVDKYMADQLLIYMALYGGKIMASEITDHCKTNIYVIKKFLDVKFKIKKNLILADIC